MYMMIFSVMMDLEPEALAGLTPKFELIIIIFLKILFQVQTLSRQSG